MPLPAANAILLAGAFTVPGRHTLQKFFSSFPDGWPGIGLILMRLTVALSTMIQAIWTLTAPGNPSLTLCTIELLAIIAGTALLAGFLTPIASASITAGNSVAGVSLLLTAGPSARTMAVLYLLVMSIVLLLLGPGAFSLDARLFGRREIIIPEGRRPPR
jgi:uncharacterized membrane protein YphA (DoxX/SURF4 family)